MGGGGHEKGTYLYINRHCDYKTELAQFDCSGHQDLNTADSLISNDTSIQKNKTVKKVGLHHLLNVKFFVQDDSIIYWYND